MNKEQLESKGWRKVGAKCFGYTRIALWTHDDHQPNVRGLFTQTQAIAHQRKLDKGYRCNCVPKVPA